MRSYCFACRFNTRGWTRPGRVFNPNGIHLGTYDAGEEEAQVGQTLQPDLFERVRLESLTYFLADVISLRTRRELQGWLVHSGVMGVFIPAWRGRLQPAIFAGPITSCASGAGAPS